MCTRRIIGNRILSQSDGIILSVKYSIKPFLKIYDYILDKKPVSSYTVVREEDIHFKFQNQEDVVQAIKNLKNLSHCEECDNPKNCIK